MPRAAPTARSRARLWWTVGVISLVTVVLASDNTILSVALPTLSRELGASTSELQWIVDAYVLAFAGLLLTAGDLGDRYGHVRVFRAGLVIFGAASVLGAFAGSPLPLVVARGLKGVGAAFTLPAATAIISNIHADPKRRARLLGAWTSVSSLGLAIGPILGGFLLAHLWWGALFLLPVPFVILGVIGTFFMGSDARRHRTAKTDVTGVVLSIVAMGTLVGAMIHAPDNGWGSASTLGLFVLAAALIGAFVTWELRCPRPMLELRMFRNRRFSVANLAMTLSNVCYLGTVFVTVQYLQVVQGRTPLEAGIGMVPLAAAVMITSLVSPRVAERAGTTRLAVSGLLSSATALFVLSRVTETSGYLPVAVGLAGLGVGIGLLFPPAVESVMGSVPREKSGMAAGTTSTTRQVGNAMGVAVFGSALASGYRAAIVGVVTAAGITAAQLARASESPAQAFAVAHDLPARGAHVLHHAAIHGFVSGMRTGMLIGVVLLLTSAALTARWLPARAAEDQDAGAPQPVGVTAGDEPA